MWRCSRLGPVGLARCAGAWPVPGSWLAALTGRGETGSLACPGPLHPTGVGFLRRANEYRGAAASVVASGGPLPTKPHLFGRAGGPSWSIPGRPSRRPRPERCWMSCLCLMSRGDLRDPRRLALCCHGVHSCASWPWCSCDGAAACLGVRRPRRTGRHDEAWRAVDKYAPPVCALLV